MKSNEAKGRESRNQGDDEANADNERHRSGRPAFPVAFMLHLWGDHPTRGASFAAMVEGVFSDPATLATATGFPAPLTLGPPFVCSQGDTKVQFSPASLTTSTPLTTPPFRLALTRNAPTARNVVKEASSERETFESRGSAQALSRR